MVVLKKYTACTVLRLDLQDKLSSSLVMRQDQADPACVANNMLLMLVTAMA